MKTGKSLVELATELDRQRQRKVDFVAPTSQISVEPVIPANDNPGVKVGISGAIWWGFS